MEVRVKEEQEELDWSSFSSRMPTCASQQADLSMVRATGGRTVRWVRSEISGFTAVLGETLKAVLALAWLSACV